MVLPSGSSQSKQWGDLPSRAPVQVMVQGAGHLVPTCHREDFLVTLHSPPSGTNSDGQSTCCAQAMSQADVGKSALGPLGALNTEHEPQVQHWVLCMSSENFILQLCLKAVPLALAASLCPSLQCPL